MSDVGPSKDSSRLFRHPGSASCQGSFVSAFVELDDQADDFEVGRQDYSPWISLFFLARFIGAVTVKGDAMAPVDRRLIEAVNEYRHLVDLEDTDCSPAPLADVAALNAARLALHAAVELAVLQGWTPDHDHYWRPSSNERRTPEVIDVVSSMRTR